MKRREVDLPRSAPCSQFVVDEDDFVDGDGDLSLSVLVKLSPESVEDDACPISANLECT